MSRARRRADRIRAEIDIGHVLTTYGYQVHAGAGSEEQFPCDLHGDGHDSKPSARVYPDTNSWYCWACDQSRDAIETVREKENLGFWEAVKKLEKDYGLPPLPWEDDEIEELRRRKELQDVTGQVAKALDTSRTYEDDHLRVFTLLDNLTVDRDLSAKATAGLWEAFDKVSYMVRKERISEHKGRLHLARIREAAMAKIKGASA